MKVADLKKLATVISIHEDSTNIIFLNKHSLSMEDANYLARLLKENRGSDFGAICMVDGPPELAAKLISTKDLEDK